MLTLHYGFMGASKTEMRVDLDGKSPDRSNEKPTLPKSLITHNRIHIIS